MGARLAPVLFIRIVGGRVRHVNEPSERMTPELSVGWFFSPVYWRVGFLVVSFICRAAAAAQVPFEGDALLPPELSVEGERGGVGWPASSSARRMEAARFFSFCCWSCTKLGTSGGPFIVCGTNFFHAGVRAECVPAWLRVTRSLAMLEQ